MSMYKIALNIPADMDLNESEIEIEFIVIPASPETHDHPGTDLDIEIYKSYMNGKEIGITHELWKYCIDEAWYQLQYIWEDEL